VIADQSFPACVPSTTEKDCLKIIILEGGSIKDLADELITRVGNRRLPKGTLIMVFSASCLSEIGTEAYARQLVLATKSLQEKFGKATKVLPLPPVFLGGCDQQSAVRSAFEILAWTEAYFGDEQHLEATAQKAKEIMLESGSNMTTWELTRFQLPCRASPAGVKTWASGGEEANMLPAIISPLTRNKEKAYVTALIEEIREKHALDLEPHPSLEKTMGSQSRPRRKVTYMVVGGSNARRLSKALTEAGHCIGSVINTDWRITKENCVTMAQTLVTLIKNDDPDYVVLHLLDSSIFYTRKTDGSKELPRKGEDGKYHVEGELVVCSYEQQTEHFNHLLPILDVIGKRPCLFVSPLPRYVIEGCCQDARHVSNRLDPFYQDDQLDQLDGVRRHLKAYMFNHRRKNVKVVDVAMEMRGLENDDIWFIDPVHPIDPVYRRLANGVTSVAASFAEDQDRTEPKRRRTDSWDEGGQRRGPPAGAHGKPREFNNSRHGDYEEERTGSGGHASHSSRGYRGRGNNRRPGGGGRGYFRASRGQFY
jgi:hypothetical protein